MSISSDDLASIRDGLAELPELAHHTAGNPVLPGEIFFPVKHASALDPNVSLVIGNRGVGKSFWASALAGAEARSAIARTYRNHRRGGGRRCH